MTDDLNEILAGRNTQAEENPVPVEIVEKPERQEASNPVESAQPDLSDETPDTDAQVPVQARNAERNKRKAAEKERDDYKQHLERMTGEMSMLRQMFQQAPQFQPQQQEQKPKPEFWEDPNAYTGSVVDERLSPLERKLEQQSQAIAINQYGKETVEKAYQAMGQAIQRGDPNAIFEYQKIKANSALPYNDIVSWFQKDSVLNEVGQDPAAYRQKLKDELKLELAAEFQSQNAAPQQQQPAQSVNLPSSFSRGGQGNSRPVPIDPNASLDQILKGRKRT